MSPRKSLGHHFEQTFHVPYRLARYRAGRRMGRDRVRRRRAERRGRQRSDQDGALPDHLAPSVPYAAGGSLSEPSPVCREPHVALSKQGGPAYRGPSLVRGASRSSTE